MTGTLGLFSLVDLFQLLSGASRTGRLSVDHPGGAARIYFDKGDVVHAQFGDVEGEEAVYALFADERGTFEFRAGLAATRTTIDLKTQNLVLEAVRRLDEGRRDDGAGSRVQPDRIPERVEDQAVADLSLGTDEQAFLALLDGRRSLGRIAELADLEFEEAARIASRLVAVGAVVMRKRRARTARLVVRAAAESLPPDVVAVDASIVEAWGRAIGAPPREVLCKRDDGRVDRLRVAPRPGAGPYLLFGRDVLLRTGLVADQALLVRPYEEDAK